MASVIVGSGSNWRAVLAQRRASVIEDSRPAVQRAMNADPRAAPSGTATTSTGKAGHVGTGHHLLSQGVDGAASHQRPCGGEAVEHGAGREGARYDVG